MIFSRKLVMRLAVCAAAFIPTQNTHAADGDVVMTNPLNLKYLFEEGGAVHRTCADPVIVLYHDKYYLFSSHASGYSWSTNLRDWTHRFSNMPLVKEWAPAVMVYNDYIYYMAFGDSKLYRTNDPENDKWELVNENVLPGTGDPDFFVDKDNRVYFLYGCSSGGPMRGFEVDPKQNFKRITDDMALVPANGKRLGWEVPGDNNEFTDKTAWNEGACIIHSGDYYFYTYATPGTEYTTYCTGAYVSKNPLGPYEVMKGAPYAIKPEGFIPGGGHGHSFVDRYGNEWWVASLILGSREHFERRIGIFPAFHNKDYGHVIMDDFDKPFVVPNRKMDFEKESILLDLSILSSGKKMTASSWKGDMTPDKAADDYIRSWWSANSGNSGEWLQMDLGRTMNVRYVQACFADEDFNSRRYDNNIPTYKYVIEGSTDGNNWHVVADRSNNNQDQIYELLEMNEQIRYVRITNRANFNPGKFSLTELRVFGKDNVATPSAVSGFNAVRGDDARRIQASWNAVDNAEGYIVRWGATPDHLDHASRVYRTSVDYGFFDSMSDYYVSVQPFNEAGLGTNSRIVKLAQDPIAQYVYVNNTDDKWYQQTYVTVNQGGGFKVGPQFNGGFAGTWRWTGPNGFSSNDREFEINGVDASKAGLYTLKHTDNGVERTSFLMVNVNTGQEITPWVNTGGDAWRQTAFATLPAGGTLKIGPWPNGGNDGWSWKGPNGFSANTREIDIENITPEQGGIYTVTYNKDGRSSSFQFNVTVCPQLISYVTDNVGQREATEIAVTAGERFTLSPKLKQEQNGRWEWVGPNGFTSNSQEVSVNNASTSNDGIYFVTFKSDNGSESSTSISVRVLSQGLNITPYMKSSEVDWFEGSKISVNAGGSISIGPKESNGFGNDRAKWEWEGPNNYKAAEREITINNVTVANAGTYTLTFTDQYGRRAKADFEVEVIDLSGIDGVEASKENATIYDLSGNKINNPTKPGIYIVNNQKFVKKK